MHQEVVVRLLSCALEVINNKIILLGKIIIKSVACGAFEAKKNKQFHFLF